MNLIDPSTCKIIFNPAAGNSEDLSRRTIEYYLERHQLPYEWITLSDLKKLATTSETSHTIIIIIVGGDGTLNRVLNAIGHRNLHKFSFAVIPAGTGNDFARSLNIPMNLGEAFELLANGAVVNHVDLGIINDRICFACAMSLGFGPEVTKNATRKLKCLLGRGALYLGACLYMLRPKRLYHIKSIINRERVQRIKTPHLVIGNGKYHGGGFPISPISHLQNACLDLYYFRPVGLRQIPGLLYKVFCRNQDHTLLEEVTHRQITEMQMWLNHPLDADIDGDIHRFYRQIHVRVKPGVLKVLAPATAALQDKPIQGFARKLVGRHRRAS